MSTRALHLVAYDITRPKRLRRALHAVRAHATGGQKSAHECFLSVPERHALLARLRAIAHPRADRVFALRLDPRSTPRTLGIARPPLRGSFIIIG
ncbi:MAG: CRISPR-associated endonuclease Cas2 [Acetobacteraceae bacterium]|nr:CRISPR-associated endonuclease Cas2 [Acetobacteraceae bacterium]